MYKLIAMALRTDRALSVGLMFHWEYRDFPEAQARLGHSLEEVYNQMCLHSALHYLPPVEFEHWYGGG